MTQYAFYLDTSRCTGCKTCELACKDYRDLGADVAFRKIYDYEGGTWRDNGDGTYATDAFSYHLSMSCNHCDDPACVGVCPTGAMHKDEQTGLVSVDSPKCIGCGYCSMACPYNVPKVDRTLGYTVKCDGCAARVAEGREPMCVSSCPLRALSFGPVEEMAQLGVRADLAPLPDPGYTTPNFFVTYNPDARAVGSADGVVANPLEVS